MFIEEQEYQDWNVTPDMSNDQRKTNSIQAYWLDKWYEKMAPITFPTVMYFTVDDIPEILPFEKCMVRYENKSPKDSEFWTFVGTKKEMLNIFYTSLRCKTNPGNIYCVRKWEDLTTEYRCFWNNGLVAVSSELDIEPPIDEILDYIKSIESYVCYNKCVFDIAHLASTNKLIFIEYNSWESNSGAHRFDWLNDTEVFYLTDCVTFRWLTGEKKIYTNCNQTINKINKIDHKQIKHIDNFDKYQIITPTQPSNWLVTNKYIYVANDIWLGRFTLNMKPLNWTRSVFRFNNLQLCEDGCIYAEPNYYYYNLTPKKTKSKIISKNNKKTDGVDNLIYLQSKYKYGFIAIDENDKFVWMRMLDDCTFAISDE